MRSGRREALSRRVEPRPVLMARMAGSPLTVSLDHGRIEALKSSNFVRVIGRGVMSEVSLARFRKDGRVHGDQGNLEEGYVIGQAR